MRLCPRCRMPARAVGRVFATTAGDGSRHAVVGICGRCITAIEKLPDRKDTPLGWGRILERAMADPARFMVKALPDPGLAELAVALCGHPDWARETLDALALLE